MPCVVCERLWSWLTTKYPRRLWAIVRLIAVKDVLIWNGGEYWGKGITASTPATIVKCYSYGRLIKRIGSTYIQVWVEPSIINPPTCWLLWNPRVLTPLRCCCFYPHAGWWQLKFTIINIGVFSLLFSSLIPLLNFAFAGGGGGVYVDYLDITLQGELVNKN